MVIRALCYVVSFALIVGAGLYMFYGADKGLAIFHFDRPGIEWAVRFEVEEDGSAAFVRSAIKNVGQRAVRLGKCFLVDASDVQLGDGAGHSVILICSGTSAPSKVRQIRSGASRHISKTIAQFYNPTNGVALHLGFVSFDRINTEHEISSSEQGPIAIRSYCDFEGYELAPGQSVKSEALMVVVNENPHAALERWADTVALAYRPRIPSKIPSGWVGWSWVDAFNVERYEDVVRRNAKAIRRRLPGFDIEYIWVSIGNIKNGYPGNWLEWNDDSFPSGVEKLTADLGALGLKLGLWVAPFWMCTHLTDHVEQMCDAFLTKDGHPLLDAKQWSHGASGALPAENRPAMHCLDPTHPKTHDFLRKTFQTYYKWGVRYYMIDFLHAGSGSTPGTYLYDTHHDTDRIPGPDAYRAGLEVIREAAGADTYLLSSTGPTYQSIGLVDACRAGNDYGEGRALNPEAYFYPATFVINNAQFWTSHARATEAMAAGYFTHAKLYLADSGNVMTVDKPVSVADAQITATLFGINGGPMMLGDDIDSMSDERLSLIKKNLPRLPECAKPIDLFDCPEPDYAKVFHVKVERYWDTWDLVAVFNYGGETLHQNIQLDCLDVVPGQYAVWDFWNERYDQVVDDDFVLTIPPTSVRLIRLSRFRPHPWLVSTDMHIRQGQAEIEDCVWDSKEATLTIRAIRPSGEKGNAFILVPEAMALRNPGGYWVAKDGRDNRLIVRCAFEFDGAPVEKRIEFMPIEERTP